jgi:hypothetical protein
LEFSPRITTATLEGRCRAVYRSAKRLFETDTEYEFAGNRLRERI